jgi:hypothetical protein
MRIRIDGKNTIETNELTLEQLRELKLKVDNASDIIQRQIDLAKAERITTGKYADPTWYANANYTMRQMRKTGNRLQELIGIRARQAKASERSIANYFMDVCKELMSERTFAEFLAEAERRKDA